MTLMMTFKIDTDLEQPPWFSTWFSEVLPQYLYEYQSQAGAVPDVVGELVRHYDLIIDPLLNSAGQDMPRSWFSSDETLASYQAGNETAWQAPQGLLDCISVFIQKIDADPEILSRLPLEDKNEQRYFSEGGFRTELLELLRMAEWAQENGVQRVRLEVA